MEDIGVIKIIVRDNLYLEKYGKSKTRLDRKNITNSIKQLIKFVHDIFRGTTVCTLSFHINTGNELQTLFLEN